MKKFLCLALASFMAVSMVACSRGGVSGASSGVPEASSVAPSAADDVKESSEAPKSEPVTLTYWSMWNSTEFQGKVIQEAADAYSAKTGNTVKIEFKGRDLDKVIAAALEGGEKIDIFDGDFMKVSKQYAQYTADLEEMAKAVGYDDFAVKALPAAVRGWAGSLVCIPYQPYTSGVFYNKAAFTKAGITAEPKTWTEFLDVCEKLKTAGLIPLAQDDAYTAYTFGFQLARYIGQDAVKKVSAEGLWAETPEVLKAANDIASLKTKGYLSSTAPDVYPDGQNEIGFDKAAMVVNASWVPSEITNNTQCDIEWGMFNYPTVDGGKDPQTITNVGSQSMAITKKCENQQAAFDFVMSITSGEFDQKMALESNGIPADTRNTEWPKLIAGCKDAFNTLTDVYDWNAGLGENPNIGETLNKATADLFGGKVTGEQFVAAMEAAK